MSDFDKSDFNKSGGDSSMNLRDLLKHKKVKLEEDLARKAEAEESREKKLELLRVNRIKPFMDALMSDLTREISKMKTSRLTISGTIVITSTAFRRELNENEFFLLSFNDHTFGLISSIEILNTTSEECQISLHLNGGESRIRWDGGGILSQSFFRIYDGTVYFSGPLDVGGTDSVFRIDLDLKRIEKVHSFSSTLTSFDVNEIGIIATTQATGNYLCRFSTGIVGKIPNHGKKSSDSAISPCSRYIAISSNGNKEILLYQEPYLTEYPKSVYFKSYPISIAFSSDSQDLFVTTWDGVLHVVDVRSLSIVDEISGLKNEGTWDQTDLSGRIRHGDMIPQICGKGYFQNQIRTRCERYVFSERGIFDTVGNGGIIHRGGGFEFLPVPLYPTEAYLSITSQVFQDSFKEVALELKELGFQIKPLSASSFKLEWQNSVI